VGRALTPGSTALQPTRPEPRAHVKAWLACAPSRQEILRHLSCPTQTRKELIVVSTGGTPRPSENAVRIR
jgi:hypothetical protein